MGKNPQDERTVRALHRLRQELLTRPAVALVIWALDMVLALGGRSVHQRAVGWLAFTGLVLNGPYYLAALTGWRLRAQAYARLLVDVALITAGVYIVGGLAAGPYIGVYAIVAVYAGIVFSGEACLLATAASTLSFVVVALGQQFRWLGPRTPTASDQWTVAIFNLAVLNITGGLTAFLSAKYRRTHAALSRSAQRLEALQHIDRSILAAESPEGIARAALPRLRRVVPCAWAAVVTFEGDLAQVMVLDGAAPFSEGATLCPGDLPAPQVLPTTGIRYLDDLTPLRGCLPVFDRLLGVGTRSLISAPLAVDGRAVGLLAVAAGEPGAFTSDQAEIVGEVANQLAVAIHQAGLRRALDLQQARLSAMIEHLPEGVLLLDGTDRVVLANAAARAHFPLVARLHPDGRVERVADRPLGDLLAAPADGAPLEARVDQKILQVAARRLDTFPGAILVVRDITSERTAHAVAERQARLAAVGQLAAGIAHDFNNILMTIISCAEMALRRPTEPELQTRWLTTITDQGHHAAALVRQVLDFSRQSTPHLRPVDLGALVLETAGLLERTLPETIRIVPDVVAGRFITNADPNQLGQVLTNLAVNARDAMPSGGELRVTLSDLTVRAGERVTPDLQPGPWAVLSVSDTGTGMPPEVRERIFEPFFTTKAPGRGTGLGLSQVYGIVKQHQGEILVESQPGRGTTFKLFLPLLADQAPTDGQAGRPTAVGGRGETLLVVEDNAALRAALSETLSGLGYRVLTASSGEDGLALWERHQRDIKLVLSDLVMPGMDGVGLVQALRRRDPATKVVIMSGYLGESVHRQNIDGVLAWVQKPGRPHELAAVIRRALTHSVGDPDTLGVPTPGWTSRRQETPS